MSTFKTFIGFALSGFRVSLWCTHKWAKVWYLYILGSCGVHWRNICYITAGSTWALQCKPPCVTDLICWIYIILKLDSHQRLVGIYLLVEVNLKAQNAIWNFRSPCDHKHLHNNFFFLWPSFHSPWIIVTIINYIDNKRNSMVIHFLVL